jgi:hypothetical protein
VTRSNRAASLEYIRFKAQTEVIQEISSFRIAEYSGIKVSVFPVPEHREYNCRATHRGSLFKWGVVYGGVSPPSNWL